MGLADLWNGVQVKRIEQLARQIATQCQQGIIARIADGAQGMSLAEIRGYTRALAGGIIRREAADTLARQGAHGLAAY